MIPAEAITIDLVASRREPERLHAGLGWKPINGMPGYVSWPQGGPRGTTIFHRTLA